MELLQKRSGSALLLALEQLAGHYRSGSNVAELKKTLDQLLETFPDDPVTVRETSLFARECLDKGNWSEASDMFSRVEKKLSAQDKEGLKLARAMSSATGNAATLIRAADTRLTEDSSVLAARLYEEALKRDPPTNEKREAMTKLGWCLYLQRKHGDAEKIWREVMNSGPKGDEWRGKSRWHLVTLHAGSKNDVKTAIALCDDQAKEFAGGFLGQQAVFSKAWLLKITGQWQEAKEGFEQLLAEYPATADAPPVHQYIKECEEKLTAGKQ